MFNTASFLPGTVDNRLAQPASTNVLGPISPVPFTHPAARLILVTASPSLRSTCFDYDEPSLLLALCYRLWYDLVEALRVFDFSSETKRLDLRVTASDRPHGHALGEFTAPGLNHDPICVPSSERAVRRPWYMKSSSMTCSSRQVMETHEKTSPGHTFETHISNLVWSAGPGGGISKPRWAILTSPRATSFCHGQHEAAASHHGTAIPGGNCSRPAFKPLHWFASCMCACLHEVNGKILAPWTVWNGMCQFCCLV